MALHKLITAVILGLVLRLAPTSAQVDSSFCFCPEIYIQLCGYYGTADVMVHGTVLSRTEDTANFSSIVNYIVHTVTLYKGEPADVYAKDVHFFTAGPCDVVLEVGEEYILGLTRINNYEDDSDGIGQLTISFCDLARTWSSANDEEKIALEHGCDDDPCDGACGRFEDCLYYREHSDIIYYCGDACDPDPCEEEEVCSSVKELCPRKPCPSVAICRPSKGH